MDAFCYVPQGFAAGFEIPAESGLRVTPERLQEILKAASDHGVTFLPGGSVANTMAGVAALGGKAGYFGKFFSDELGKRFAKDLKIRGIDLLCKPASGIEHSIYTPALCVILVEPDKISYMAYNPGCADNFSAKDFEKFDFARAKYFLIETHSLRDSPFRQDMLDTIKLAKAKGCKIVFALHDIGTWWAHKDLATDIVGPLADIILCSHNEMKEFVAVQPLPINKEQLVVTTLGVEGSRAQLCGRTIHMPASSNIDIENSIGAGDQYLAGLLIGLSHDMPLEKCMELAMLNAEAVLEERGARPSFSARPAFNLKHLLKS